jgi:hypothetical protein
MPLALAYIMVVCVAIYLIQHVLRITDPLYQSLALFGINVVIAGLVFGLLDSNVFIRGSGRQRRAVDARARRAPVTGRWPSGSRF